MLYICAYKLLECIRIDTKEDYTSLPIYSTFLLIIFLIMQISSASADIVEKITYLVIGELCEQTRNK